MRLKLQQNSQGFSLVELMAAVAIIGILASMTVSAYVTFQIRAARTEAFVMIKSMQALAESYKSTNSTFTGVPFTYGRFLYAGDMSSCGPNNLGFSVKGCLKLHYHYDFRLDITDASHYTIAALSASLQSPTVPMTYGNPVSTKCTHVSGGLTRYFQDNVYFASISNAQPTLTYDAVQYCK